MTDICVMMSVYNAEKTLAPAIQSILTQGYRDFELLVIDDHSSDRSPQIIAKFARFDSRVRPVYYASNLGLTQRLREGLEKTDAEFVARMDADDISFPERIGTQAAFMKIHSDISVVGGFAYMMGVVPFFDRLARLPETDWDIKQILPERNCLFHPSVMMRRRDVLEAGSYRSEFRAAQDYDLWLRMSRRGFRFANIPQPLIRYRYSINGITLAWKWEQLYYAYLAQVSYSYPELKFIEMEKMARQKLEACDRPVFLKNVTKGTCKDLVRLGYVLPAAQLFFKMAKNF